MIQLYEKIPSKVQVVRFLNTDEATADLKELMGEQLPKIWHTCDDEDIAMYMFVPTFEGKTKAVDGDYITKDADGHFFVYNPKLFNKIYKKVWD